MSKEIIDELFEVIRDRKTNRKEKSYVCSLYDKGHDKILEKIIEEAGEVVIASKNRENKQIIYESADLLFHLLVMLSYHDLTPDDIFKELQSRRK